MESKYLPHDKLMRRKTDEEETPLMLINEISRLFKCRMRSESAGIPDTYRPIIIQLYIFEKLTQIELAQRVHLKAPTVCVTLQKMEAEGYVMREPDANDLRKIWVSLTEKGRLINDNILKKIKAVDNDVMKNITKEEAETLCALLRKVRGNMFDNIEGAQNEL